MRRLRLSLNDGDWTRSRSRARDMAGSIAAQRPDRPVEPAWTHGEARMILRSSTSTRLSVVLLLASLGPMACGGGGRATLTLGIPTTVEDSGLLEALLPRFESAHPGYHLRYVSAGSGELLALGARGDLDALIAHSPGAEARFMAAGHGLDRSRVMENDFLIVGPAGDPAAIGGMSDAAAALARIDSAGGLFLSRGDDSGTHRKELELRQAAGLGTGGANYKAAGDGMAAVLRAASDLGAYTLCDRGTYLHLRSTLDLEPLVEGDPRLRNVYHVIVTANAREPDGARAFSEWLTSAGGQAAIGGYGEEEYGRPLFFPAAESEDSAG